MLGLALGFFSLKLFELFLELRRRLGVGVLQAPFDELNFFCDLLDFGRERSIYPELGRGFVEEIYRFVGEESVGDIARRKLRRRSQAPSVILTW
jgi:hypothetical protein